MSEDHKKRGALVFGIAMLVAILSFFMQAYELTLALMVTSILGLIYVLYFSHKEPEYRDGKVTAFLTFAGLLFLFGGLLYLLEGNSLESFFVLTAGFVAILPGVNDYMVKRYG